MIPITTADCLDGIASAITMRLPDGALMRTRNARWQSAGTGGAS